jgi:amino-acid N-acetyltransferase
MKLNRTEIPYATELLKDNELPYSDINTESVQLFSIEQDKQTIGIIGFEQYGKHGLLRSFVIEKQYRSKGLGARILSDFEKMASEQGITEFFILTTTADKFFARNGFEVFDRNAVPQLIANTTEFDSICPASAVCMRKIL